MVILGESAPRVKRAADKAKVAYLEAEDVAGAAKLAFESAESGDIVLLSPANASWDMYKNFEVRGDEFIAAFEAIKETSMAKRKLFLQAAELSAMLLSI